MAAFRSGFNGGRRDRATGRPPGGARARLCKHPALPPPGMHDDKR